MRASSEPLSGAWPLRPLAACVAATFTLLPLSACALTVSTCDDAGAGSLRAAAANTASGGTIDMTALDCVITLTTGQIDLTQNKLTIVGPGQDHLTISGGNTLRVFRHHAAVTNPTPELYISDVTISNGYQYGLDIKGGCIFEDNNLGSTLHLTDTTVSGCHVDTYGGSARGGAVFASHVFMTRSTISDSMVSCNQSGSATGGGVFASVMYATDLTIANNQAYCEAGGTAKAGGAYVGATAKFTSTTISGNSSTGDVGGLYTSNESPVNLINSTVSGNSANGFVGGLALYFAAGGVISYSTITRNVAGQGSAGIGVYRSPGAHLVTTNGMKILNSILADNTYGPSNTENDLSAPSALNFQVDHNLIGVSTSSIANDNITNVCPLLGPLRDNGGLTKTHALLSHSPAIDAGVYTFGSQPTFDQRGSPYARVITASFIQKIDIGAYEVQPTDIIFNAGLDGCVSLP